MATDSKNSEGFIDIDAESGPGIENTRLYRLWEEGNWSAMGLDFTQDASDWREKLSEQQRTSILWNYAMFLDGEESVTITLAPFLEAMSSYEDKIFLATQIADEARHHVFFDRFLREVCGVGKSFASTLEEMRPHLTWGYVKIFSELDLVAERLRRFPRNTSLLAQGLVLYHLIVEGMLAHTGQHFLRDYTTRNKLFPGFAQGIHMVTRDESRHIAFGIQTLRELVLHSPTCKAAAIEMLNRVLPWAAGVFVPPHTDWSYLTCLGYTQQEVFAFALRSVETKLRRAGIPPSEVLTLVTLGCDDPPVEQAERVITLIEGGILGTDHAPHITEAAMDALFLGIRNTAAWTQERQRTLNATIQWNFVDVQPRYLTIEAQSDPQVFTGMAPKPDLTLECSAADWVLLARNSLDQRQAILTRRLRIRGNWKLALQLPRILPS